MREKCWKPLVVATTTLSATSYHWELLPVCPWSRSQILAQHWTSSSEKLWDFWFCNLVSWNNLSPVSQLPYLSIGLICWQKILVAPWTLLVTLPLIFTCGNRLTDYYHLFIPPRHSGGEDSQCSECECHGLLSSCSLEVFHCIFFHEI